MWSLLHTANKLSHVPVILLTRIHTYIQSHFKIFLASVYCWLLLMCEFAVSRFNPCQSRWWDDRLFAVTTARCYIWHCPSWRLSWCRPCGNGNSTTRRLRPTQTLPWTWRCSHRSLEVVDSHLYIKWINRCGMGMEWDGENPREWGGDRKNLWDISSSSSYACTTTSA